MAESDQLLAMFRQMVLIRRFDELAMELRLEGRIYGVVHPYIGQEAIAVGVCAQLDGNGAVAVGFFGDGATGAGAFHESMNIASLWKLPVVYVCENNQHAVDTPIAVGLATTEVATSANAYGFPGGAAD